MDPMRLWVEGGWNPNVLAEHWPISASEGQRLYNTTSSSEKQESGYQCEKTGMVTTFHHPKDHGLDFTGIDTPPPHPPPRFHKSKTE